MEKNFNTHEIDSNCSSDTDSQDDENYMLFNFLLDNCNKENGGTSLGKTSTELIKPIESKKKVKEASKSVKGNGKPKKIASAQRKDLESQYRKVLVTTDLKSDTKISKTYNSSH